MDQERLRNKLSPFVNLAQILNLADIVLLSWGDPEKSKKLNKLLGDNLEICKKSGEKYIELSSALCPGGEGKNKGELK